MKAFNAYIKPFEAPQRSVKIKIQVNFFFLSGIRTLRVIVVFILVQRFISEDKLPHLLFYGPPGTGKTSTILAVAQQLYSPQEFHSMVLEVRLHKTLFQKIVSNFLSSWKMLPAKVINSILEENA